MIHRPHWKWLIIGYFFCGGISGASAVIASVARLVGGPANARTARVATFVSFATLAPCPAFLILDLGRPGRFFNMLHAFRPTSPMSMGTWILTAFGILSMLTAGCQRLLDRGQSGAHRPRRAASSALTAITPLYGILGFGVAGYTGVLLAATAVPLWSKRPWLLGPLFLSSAMTSGAAAVSAATAIVAPEEPSPGVHLLESVAAVSEAALLGAWITSLGPTSRAVTDGHVGNVMRSGVIGAGTIAPPMVSLLTRRLPRRLRRVAMVASSALTLAGVLALRYVVVEGGRVSSDDPRATFELAG